MKRSIIFLLSICVLLFSCSDGDDPVKEVEKPPIENKDPFITLKKSNIDFTNKGGSESITIESNVTWATKSSASWCTVSPTSGSSSTTSITLSAPANEKYDTRSCTVTIESGNISKTITVNQGENLGLLVTQDRYELGNEESTIKVEVKANVEFDIEIADEWITRVETRGLTTSQIEFKIAKNDTYGNREGSITIKQKGGNMSSTITIFQSQEDAIILSEKEFDLSSAAQSIDVEIKTNIDYEIIIPEDAKGWVSHSATRALRTETVVLDIAKNEDYDERTVEVIVKDKKTDLQEVVTIKQAANTGLIVSHDKYEVSNEGEIIEVEVKANVNFKVDISESWITQVETRGLVVTKLQFEVHKNEGYDAREATITIFQTDGNLKSSIKVYQSQKDAIIISDKTVNLSNEKQAIDVELKTNVEFEVIIPQAAKSWVSYTPTRGLRTETLTLNIAENKDYDARSTEVYVKNKKTNLQDTLTINQAANTGLIVSDDKYELSNDGGTFNVEVKANIDYKVTINDNWITQIETRGLTSTNLTFEVAKNESYSNREGTITISQKDGDLSSTIAVYQSQENAIILSEKDVEVSDRSQTLNVVIKTNVDVDVAIQEVGKNWVSYTPTRGLREESLQLNISANNSDKNRSTEVYIKDKLTSLQETLTITQIGKEPGVYYVDKMGTLGKILNQTQKDTITTMIIKGEINSSDFYVMNRNMPRLKHIDLTDVRCDNNEIPYAAFSENKTISTIEFPLSITKIGAFAFNKCKNLKGPLNLPDKLTSIDKAAFQLCTGLTSSLIIPDGVTSIGESAFSRCSGFTGSLILPDKLTIIGNTAFLDCRGFTGDLVIPDGVTSIDEDVFMACDGFTGSLIFPDKLTSIGKYAFTGCRGFTGDLVIPDGVTSIDDWAFLDCSGFNGSLILPENLSIIGDLAFGGCRGFTGSLIIPNGITTLQEFVFDGCFGFTKLILSENLTSIGNYAFHNCSGFRGSLAIPNGVTTIGESAFRACQDITELVLNENLESIGSDAFYYCLNIRGRVILPKSLNELSSGAFMHCNRIDSFQFPHVPPLDYRDEMLPYGALVEVPYNAVTMYKSTYGWHNHPIVGY